MRRTMLLAATCLLVLVGLVSTAAAGPIPRPFGGTAVGDFWVTPDPDCPIGLRSHADGTGPGTLLGLTSIAVTHCTPNTVGSVIDPIVGGQFTFTAANADTLEATYTGTVQPFDFVPGATIHAHLEATIVGGTGRFEGAIGHADVAVLIPHLVIGGVSVEVTSWAGTVTY